MTETPNGMKGRDYDRSIHHCSDANKWAEFFIQTKAENKWAIDDIDHGLMLGWFANAMMAMHDYLKSQDRSAYLALEKQVEELKAHREKYEIDCGRIEYFTDLHDKVCDFESENSRLRAALSMCKEQRDESIGYDGRSMSWGEIEEFEKKFNAELDKILGDNE